MCSKFLIHFCLDFFKLLFTFSQILVQIFSSDFFKTLDVLSLRHFDLHFCGIGGRVKPGKIKKIYFRTWLELRTIQDQIYTRIPWKFIWKYLKRGGLCFDSKLCDVNNENIAIWPQRPTSYNKLHKYLAVNSFDLSIQINLILCLISRVQICSLVVVQISWK